MKIKNLPVALAQGVISLAILTGCGGGGEEPPSLNAQASASSGSPMGNVQEVSSATNSDAPGVSTIAKQSQRLMGVTTEKALVTLTTEQHASIELLATTELATTDLAVLQMASTEITASEIAIAEIAVEAADEFSTDEFATDPSQETTPGGFIEGELRGAISLNDWANFYNNKYKAYAFARTTELLQIVYDRHRRTSDPSLPVLTLADIRASAATMTTALNRLPVSKRTEFAAAVKRLIRFEASINNAPFTLPELDKYLNGLLDHSHAQVNYWLQHHQAVRDHVEVFFASASHATQASRFIALREAAEKTDDKRFLRGPEEDTVVETTDWYWRKVVSIKLGNQRAPVERANLVRSWTVWSRLGFDSKYTRDSSIKHGYNSTSIEPSSGSYYLRGVTTSDAYVLGDNQDESIDYYINADIEKNGSLPFHNVEQTRRALRGATRFLARETGLTYESYTAAQLLARAIGQAGIAAARMAIDKKYIDLGLMATSLTDEIMESEANKKLAADSLSRLRGAVGSLVGLTLGQIAMNVVYIRETENAYNAGNATKTDAQITSDAAARIKKVVAPTQSATALASLGVLGGFSISSAESRSSIMHYIPGAFAASDLAAGIGDLVSVLRLRKWNTGAGASSIAAALVRTTGALYTLDDKYGYKCFSHTFKKVLGPNITPIKFTTWTAAFASGFYMIGFATTAAGI